MSCWPATFGSGREYWIKSNACLPCGSFFSQCCCIGAAWATDLRIGMYEEAIAHSAFWPRATTQPVKVEALTGTDQPKTVVVPPSFLVSFRTASSNSFQVSGGLP